MLNSVKFCPVCGHPLDARSQFCSMCRRWTGRPELTTAGDRRERSMRLFSAPAIRLDAHRAELGIIGIAMIVIILLVLGVGGLL